MFSADMGFNSSQLYGESGVLILPPISENDELAVLCREMGCGYVRMGSAALDEAEQLVQSNDRECVESVIDHLVANGHRRIAIIKGPDGFRSAQERAEGFAAAMKKHGLEIPPEAIGSGNYRFDSGIVAAEKLHELEVDIVDMHRTTNQCAWYSVVFVLQSSLGLLLTFALFKLAARVARDGELARHRAPELEPRRVEHAERDLVGDAEDAVDARLCSPGASRNDVAASLEHAVSGGGLYRGQPDANGVP